MSSRGLLFTLTTVSVACLAALPAAFATDHPRPEAQSGCGPEGERRCIAFTFDDGPDCHTTPRLLAMLAARSVQATFFVVGHRIDGEDNYHRANREVLRQIRAAGHAVGNHTYRHLLLDGLSPARLAFEIDRTEALIEDTLGERPTLFRAPFGALRTRRAAEAVFSRAYLPVYWTIDTADWSVTSSEAVVANFRAALNQSPRGGIVLMHDTHAWSVTAFPAVMAELERRNARLRAAGESPYAIVGVDAYYGSSGASGHPAGDAHAARR